MTVYSTCECPAEKAEEAAQATREYRRIRVSPQLAAIPGTFSCKLPPSDVRVKGR